MRRLTGTDAEGIWDVVSTRLQGKRMQLTYLRNCMSMLFNLLVVVLILAFVGCVKLFRIFRFLPACRLGAADYGSRRNTNSALSDKLPSAAEPWKLAR